MAPVLATNNCDSSSALRSIRKLCDLRYWTDSVPTTLPAQSKRLPFDRGIGHTVRTHIHNKHNTTNTQFVGACGFTEVVVRICHDLVYIVARGRCGDCHDTYLPIYLPSTTLVWYDRTPLPKQHNNDDDDG